MASWPKRSQNTSPGSIVSTPMRGAGPSMRGAVARRIVSGSGPANTGSATARHRMASHNDASRAVQAARAWPSVVAMDAEHEAVHAAAVGAADAEVEAAHRQFLAGLRQVADGGGDEAADGV